MLKKIVHGRLWKFDRSQHGDAPCTSNRGHSSDVSRNHLDAVGRQTRPPDREEAQSRPEMHSSLRIPLGRTPYDETCLAHSGFSRSENENTGGTATRMHISELSHFTFYISLAA